MRAGGIPAAARLLPNIGYSSVREGSALVPSNLLDGQVSPGPTSIGVNDLGLRTNGSGGYVATSYRTTSIDGSVTINNISLLPVMTNASDAITLQENAVLNNVTLFGQSVYQVWTQNVIFYSIKGDQLQLLTDGWNFSSGGYQLYPNDIYKNAPGGYLFTGVYVHQVPLKPPFFIVKPPFTMRFYLNSTNIAGRNAVFFNYTINSAYDITRGAHNYGRAIEDGSFDWIIFNSTADQPKGYRAPPATFLISGSQPSGGGLPNDAEMAICGPSDGFSADIRSLNASASLLLLNDTTGQYAPPASAFTTTEDTGESVEGVDAHYTAASAADGAAFLTSGPEFVYGLWNATGPGVREVRYQVALTPAAAVAWVAPRTKGPDHGFVNTSAAWAIEPGPDFAFWLPTGGGTNYVLLGMANDYAPRYALLGSTGVNLLSLRSDPAAGVYVPIIAFGNSGVAAIARSGDGSAGDPYVIEYSQSQPISSLYGVYDEFSEPIYPGLLLSGVSAHVVVLHPPSLLIQYTAADLFPLVYIWELSPPTANYLPIEVYDSSNISIVGAHDIRGWFPITLTGFLYGSLFLSNDTNCLVADNHFASMGSSMDIVDPNGNHPLENNTVFGNWFVTSDIEHSKNASSLYLVLAFDTSYTGPPAVGSLGVFSAGNLIYNNLFDTPITAYSPPQNPFLSYVWDNDLGYQDYTSVATTWHNHWNLTLSTPGYVRIVNGFRLTGNIEGAPFQGGNAWINWNGSVPYTDQGLIAAGGDALPIPIPGTGDYAVVLQEHGLPPGTAWTVSINGVPYTTTRTMFLVYLPSATYTFWIHPVDGKRTHPDLLVLDIVANTLISETYRK